MKKIKFRGKDYEQKVEPLDCVMCPYRDGCDSWGCVSPACSITQECFGFSMTGSWCPFGEIPKDQKFKFNYE